MSKLISLGITTYNNQPFIDNLIYEIENQVKNDPQILEFYDFFIFDDNSSDKAFLNELPLYFQKINNRVNHNSPAKGRNTIIERSSSKYVFFIDGDDLLIDNLMHLYEDIKSKNADIIFSEVTKVDADGQYLKSPFIYNTDLFYSQDVTKRYEKLVVHQTGIWSIYRREFLIKNNIKYLENRRYEDNYFLFEILLKNPRIQRTKIKYYGWRNNYQSFSFTQSATEQRIQMFALTMKLLKNNLENKFSPWILFSLWNQTYSNIIRKYPKLTQDEYKNYFKELNRITQKYEKEIKILRKKTNSKFTDKYFQIYQYKIFQTYGSIKILQSIKEIKAKNSIIKKNLLKLFIYLPMNKNKIFLTSQYGKYSDNPKYLYLQMKVDPKFKNKELVFAVKDKKLVKKNKDFVNYNNRILFYFHHYTAKEIYFDTWIDPNLKKRKNQTWTQLWHGVPEKKMYTDINIFNFVNSKEHIKNKEKNIKNWDYVYSPQKNNTKIFKKIFPNVEIVEKEYPRVNWLISNKNLKFEEIIKQRMKLNFDDKYTLYAPTYRPYNIYISCEKLIEMKESENKLIFLTHPLLKYTFVDKGTENKYYKQIVKLEQKFDTQEILIITDELITDYSSIAYDFLKINSKVKYYTPDIELYRKINGIYE